MRQRIDIHNDLIVILTITDESKVSKICQEFMNYAPLRSVSSWLLVTPLSLILFHFCRIEPWHQSRHNWLVAFFFLFPSFASFAYICIFHCILEAPICIIMWGKGEVVPPLLPNFRGAVGENVCSPPIGTQRLLVRVATKMFLVKTEGFLQKPNMGRNTGVIICTMDSLYIPAGSRPSASARDPAIDTQGSEWAFLRWAKGGGCCPATSLSPTSGVCVLERNPNNGKRPRK